MKETFYFSHDYNVRSDEKIKRLIRKHGMEGYGIFWTIIEDLYQNANALPLDCDGIAYELRVHCDIIKSVLHDFDLFVLNDGKFGSLSVQRRIDERDAKSKQARDNAFKRWGTDANALPSQCDRNAIKEKKVKESKVNNINTPDEDEFLKYGLSLFKENVNYEFTIRAKYESWVANGWKDGNGKPIINWKTKLKNTAPHLKPMLLVGVGVPTGNYKPAGKELI